MPKAFRNIIFTTIIYFIDFSLMAQCPDSNFSINQEDICQNESLVINNNSTLNVNYSWDFCAGDNWNRLPVFELMEDNFVSNLHSRTVKKMVNTLVLFLVGLQISYFYWNMGIVF
jgi:hypothetical protein